MNFQAVCQRWNAFYSDVASGLIAARSTMRVLSLCMFSRPRTPLRFSCIAAFDMLHVLRHAKPLPRHKVKVLAALLDFEAWANAIVDNKKWCPHEWRETLKVLEKGGFHLSVVDYLRRLEDLERQRPMPSGDLRQFEKVSLYRESVVRLALGMLALASDRVPCLRTGISATERDGELNVLFRIAMLFQIIDDVLDYSKDASPGLPSFMTALESLPHALALTRLAVLRYAEDGDVPRRTVALPLRSALFLISRFAQLAINLRRWRHEMGFSRFAGDFPESLGSS